MPPCAFTFTLSRCQILELCFQTTRPLLGLQQQRLALDSASRASFAAAVAVAVSAEARFAAATALAASAWACCVAAFASAICRSLAAARAISRLSFSSVSCSLPCSRSSSAAVAAASSAASLAFFVAASSFFWSCAVAVVAAAVSRSWLISSWAANRLSTCLSRVPILAARESASAASSLRAAELRSRSAASNSLPAACSLAQPMMASTPRFATLAALASAEASLGGG